MPCYNPIKGYRSRDGKVRFKRPSNEWALLAEVPCGQCIGCRVEKARQWAVRCVNEQQLHERSSFITLTYNNAHLPKDGSLNVKHWQKFAKRLRKQQGPFRFYHCGEYGGKTRRPHYHACVFGLDWASDRILLKQDGDNKTYTSKSLEDTWGMGFVSVSDMTFATANYVARYCIKKINGERAQEHYENVDTNTGEVHTLKPEYTTMSRNHGIGEGWYRKYKTDIYPCDFIVSNGRESRIPRYYDDLLKKEDPAQLEQIKAARTERAKKQRADNSPERLAVREEVAIAKLALQKRNLHET